MKSVAVKISASGRMHLPSEVRKVLGIEGPGHVVITMKDGAMTLRTMAQALEEVRRLARPFAPKDLLASEQLIAERREEARAEAAIPAAGQKPRRRQSG